MAGLLVTSSVQAQEELSVTPASLDLDGSPGESVGGTISISGVFTPYEISAEQGTVVPEELSQLSGEVSYERLVPSEALPGSTFTDTVTVTNAEGEQETVNVTVTLGALNEAQSSTAQAINSLCDPESEANQFQKQCNRLVSAEVSAEARREALSDIAHDDLAVQGTQAAKLPTAQVRNIQARIGALRSGLNEVIAFNGLSVNVKGERVPLGRLANTALRRLQGGGASADEGLGRSERLGFFINGRFNFGDKETTGREPGFDFDTKGVTLGLDYRLTQQFVLGGALGYGATDADFNNDGGGLDTDTGTVSLYGTYYLRELFYLDWIASYGTNDYDSTRKITPIPNAGFTGGKAKGDTNGDQVSLALRAGTDFAHGPWLLSPFLRARYIHTEVDELHEEGGGGFALEIADQTIRSLRSALGGKVARSISLPWGVLTPSIHAEWIHEFQDDERELTARFVEEQGQSFKVPTDNPDRNYFNVGTSLSVTFAGGRSAFLRYESRLGQRNIDIHFVRVGVRLPF